MRKEPTNPTDATPTEQNCTGVDVALDVALEAAEDDRVRELIRRALQRRVLLQSDHVDEEVLDQ